MLAQALKSLEASNSTDSEIQTATFANGKFRATLHVPTQTLVSSDNTSSGSGRSAAIAHAHFHPLLLAGDRRKQS